VTSENGQRREEKWSWIGLTEDVHSEEHVKKVTLVFIHVELLVVVDAVSTEQSVPPSLAVCVQW
jgi:hypothetical protein